MAEHVIKPDLDFAKEIIASGGESLKKCYQCATCSVVCNVTPDNKPFPRKEMLWAQWGLKEKFMGNPDVWLCHQCNDCTSYCPRGAKPGEVLGAIRKQSIRHYAFPGFMAKMVNNKKLLPLLFVIPALLFIIILSSIGTFHIPKGEIVYSKFFPIQYIDPVFTAAFFFAAFAGIIGIIRFWKDMSQAGGPGCDCIKSKAIATLAEILKHNKFKDCGVSKDRYPAHLLVFYGFIALAITTSLAVFYLYVLEMASPYSLTTPLKFIGNIGGIALLVGIVLMINNRFKLEAKVGIGSYFDWLLISIILTVAVSGILSELIRLANIAILAYPIYFIHLVFVFSLFLYAPYSKLAHIFYRTTAIFYNKYSERDKG